METLGVEGKQYDVVLISVILSRTPHAIRMEWFREGLGHESDISWLMSFLETETEHRERSDAYRHETRSEEIRGGTVGSERRKLLPDTASTIQTSLASCTGMYM